MCTECCGDVLGCSGGCGGVPVLLQQAGGGLQPVRCVPQVQLAPMCRQHVQVVVLQQLPHTVQLLTHTVPVEVCEHLHVLQGLVILAQVVTCEHGLSRGVVEAHVALGVTRCEDKCDVRLSLLGGVDQVRLFKGGALQGPRPLPLQHNLHAGDRLQGVDHTAALEVSRPLLMVAYVIPVCEEHDRHSAHLLQPPGQNRVVPGAVNQDVAPL
mmetsp:Transcript_1571/g.3558  ORF Transcript_1571/g.3558 Transcript_1571/m.3558 type:complete len:211 (-) Transcript_1571:492-1124(-)